MLQLLHLDVSKVDQVLCMGCVWEAAGSVDDVRDSVGDVQGGADHYLYAPSQSRRARSSFASCAGSVRTLASGSDVRTLASLKK